MSMKNKLKNFFSMDEEEYEYEYIETEQDHPKSMNSRKRNSLLTLRSRRASRT